MGRPLKRKEQSQQVMFDMDHVGRVLSALLSDQYGVDYTLTFTKKTPEELAAGRAEPS